MSTGIPVEPSEEYPTGRFAALVGHKRVEPSSIPREAQGMQGHRAGIITRFSADAIDFGVLTVALGFLYIGWSTLRFLLDPRDFTFPPVTLGEAILVGMALLWWYLTLAWWLTGRTIGKQVMGLRVVNFRGERLRFGGAAIRAAICVVFPIGLFWVLVSPANRSVADLAIRTSSIYDWSVAPPRRAAKKGRS